jgi:phasin
MTFNPDAANKNKAEMFNPMAQFDQFRFGVSVPEAWRDMAGQAIGQSQEAYERAKTALDTSLEALERSYDAAGQASAALNRKIIDIAQRNINSSFDLAKSLARAMYLAEMVELQGTFWRKQLETLMGQAEEVRALSANAANDVSEPIKRHVARQTEEVKKAVAETTSEVNRQVSKIEGEFRRVG